MIKYKKKSIVVKSGELGGHSVSPGPLIHLPIKVVSIDLLTCKPFFHWRNNQGFKCCSLDFRTLGEFMFPEELNIAQLSSCHQKSKALSICCLLCLSTH